MKDDVIYRQAAIDAVLKESNMDGAYGYMDAKDSVDLLNKLPSAQRTGRWIWDDEGYHCSECFYHAYGNTSEVMLGDFKFCPNCGCAMETEVE